VTNLVVVLGAGASFDSAPVTALPPGQRHKRASQPPLANGLFEARDPFVGAISRYPACRALLGELRLALADSSKSLEGELERIQAEAAEHAHLFRQLSAVRFYLQDIIWDSCTQWFEACSGVTNYATLLSRLETWRERNEASVTLVTFNYDLLLEWACQDVLGWEFDTLEAYVGRTDWKLIKLHGSVKWGHPVTYKGTEVHPVLHPNDLVRRIDELDISELIVQSKSLSEARSAGYFPALAIPVERKSRFECPETHLDAVREVLGRKHAALIIGWRGAEEHFVTLWAAAASPEVLQVVSGSSEGAMDVRKRLGDLGVVGRLELLGSDGFTTFLQSTEASAFLAEIG
jgi:hypothetical protein